MAPLIGLVRIVIAAQLLLLSHWAAAQAQAYDVEVAADGNLRIAFLSDKALLKGSLLREYGGCENQGFVLPLNGSPVTQNRTSSGELLTMTARYQAEGAYKAFYIRAGNSTRYGDMILRLQVQGAQCRVTLLQAEFFHADGKRDGMETLTSKAQCVGIPLSSFEQADGRCRR